MLQRSTKYSEALQRYPRASALREVVAVGSRRGKQSCALRTWSSLGWLCSEGSCPRAWGWGPAGAVGGGLWTPWRPSHVARRLTL